MNISPPLLNQIEKSIHDPILQGLSPFEDSSIEREFFSNKDQTVVELLSSNAET